MGERPGDDSPEAQAAFDALAKAAAGDLDPDDNGFDIGELNEQFAVVPIGSTVVVLWEKPEASPEERLQFLKSDAFLMLHRNRYAEVRAADGGKKWKTWGNAWLDSPRRRQYKGIEFRPDPVEAESTPGFYNLWQGFSFEPKRGGSYSIFRDHLLNNVCGGSEKSYFWLFGWFAQMFQRPREKIGTAIVLRGPMGAGKSKIGETFGSLIQAHYFQIDNARYLVGQFNAHMAACLFLQADEAVFAGDKATEGHLRGLITSERQMVESKGVDPIRLPNYIRLMMTSNEDWVIPAGKEERRFACFDIADHAMQNHEYFAEMTAQLDDGGREALLFDLLSFDLSKVNLREIPKTAALLEQKILSFDPIEQWFYDRLYEGSPTAGGDAWPDFIECDKFYKSFIAAAEQTGIRYRKPAVAFGRKVQRLMPGVRRNKRTIEVEIGATSRRWVYELPPLSDCREDFDQQIGQRSDWGDPT
ncbi:DUF5906 domain-containing protein [Mesorhizobium opportunistum]|uniref:primase-helicase family protein n=1 Tax=Mesorhizobium opportunistum TaxID=593909 RepID=UPI00333D3ECA